MTQGIHPTERGDWKIRTASGTIYRLQIGADSLLTRYAQMTSPTPEYDRLAVYDLRQDGSPIPIRAFSRVQLGEEILFVLDVRRDGIETLRRTTPAVSIEAWEGVPTPEELPHRTPRIPWQPAEIRVIDL
ncbi:hypothetical protein ASH00_15835 [Arthrobacter sp. Soil782]|uniref:hypothetical protein n=1 Tax=Arthrobacter sp. Soil782 TaxID=1736410 RepID=UPI0007021199|nr:hypothetical protein [Arthrobacter sp. Soil782]KRF03255.1 hypothetical protein ASH00_15835 [Arthrobacter sp. Soil782]